MSKRDPHLTEEKAKRLLMEKGLRVTSQRLTLLQALSRIRHPVSHPELTEQLSGEDLDRATVYRNLLSLTKAGLLVEAQLGDGVARFELPRSAGAHDEHPHFVCTDCGDVSCLPSRAVTLHGVATRVRVEQVQLRGLCESCSST